MAHLNKNFEELKKLYSNRNVEGCVVISFIFFITE